ncbi:HD domain-containing phosphohydrolase [Deinococcus misasensis]|uniref:HD domain-containing phosphohydrolase n=1 Tax=Deinococcus misasensis TaxID=392413 RepID=UPI00068D67EC|nr:HD domain-containing phosphohydrolase [Deinococcus misasensis]
MQGDQHTASFVSTHGQSPEDWFHQTLQEAKQALSGGVSGNMLEQAKTLVAFSEQLNTQQQVMALNHHGHLLFLTGQTFDALHVLLQANALLEDIDLIDEATRNHNLLGASYQILGDLQAAFPHYQSSLSLSRQSGNGLMQARTLSNIALLLQQQGKYSDALNVLTEAENLARQLDVPVDLCRFLLNKISVYLDEAKHGIDSHATQMPDWVYEARQLLEHLQIRHMQLILEQYRIEIHLLYGQLKAARQVLEAAEPLLDAEEFPEPMAHFLMFKGKLLQEEGHLEQAHALYMQALHMFETLHHQDNILLVLKHLVELHKLRGEYHLALQHHERLHQLDREVRTEANTRQLEMMSFQRKLEQSQHEAELERIRSEELEQLVQERTAELESAYLEMLERLAVAAEFRDTDTGEHTVRVGERAAEVARILNMPEDQIRVLRLAARLHDVGKIAISDTILHKPGKLTDEEYLTMKAHTLAGAKMLSDARSDLIRMAEVIALTHHERWDGGGYPQGLKGEEIPIEGRIVAVVDVLDALTSQRPYKKAWSMEEALQEIQRLSGSHFDPQVVQALLGLHKE